MKKIVAIFITLVFVTFTVQLWFSACFTHLRHLISNSSPKNGKTTSENNSKFGKYGDSAKYWEHVEATVEGMVSGKKGGSEFVSDIDLKSSEEFLNSLSKLPNSFGRTYALDCGAGIGRITKDLLSRHFDKVDLVEQSPKFIEVAKQRLESNRKIGKFFVSGLQTFDPPSAKYDVVWIQGVLCYLTDHDLVDFLHRAKKALLPQGVIVVKEVTSISSEAEFHSDDSGVTRTFALFEELFARADLKVLQYSKMTNLPSNFYPVWTFALSPNQMELKK